jgi:hypothetical protein
MEGMTMTRLLIAGVVLALIGAACADDDSETAATTIATTDSTTLGTVAPPDTSPAATITTTTPATPAAPYAVEGDLSAQVAALQFFLDCAGFGPVPIDGRFAEQTTTAVRLAQFDLGYTETGEPSAEMFAAMALTCDRGRDIFFPPDLNTTQNAGYVEPDRHEDLGHEGLTGQRLEIDAGGGDSVLLTLLAPDGSPVQEASMDELSVDLTQNGRFVLRVSAAEPAWYVLSITRTGGE